MIPVIFDEYDFKKAELAFPLIGTMATDQEIEDTAWAYTADIFRNDAQFLSDTFIGEYLGRTLQEITDYHEKVLQAVMEKNYHKAGKLVEDALGSSVDRTIDFIEYHIEQMRLRYE